MLYGFGSETETTGYGQEEREILPDRQGYGQEEREILFDRQVAQDNGPLQTPRGVPRGVTDPRGVPQGGRGEVEFVNSFSILPLLQINNVVVQLWRKNTKTRT